MSITTTQIALGLPEVVFQIVEFLELSDLCAVAQVSRLWYQAVADSLPWGDFGLDDRMAWSGDMTNPIMDLEDRDMVLAQLQSAERPRSLTCKFKVFPGKAIYTGGYEQVQTWAWKPIMDHFVTGHDQLYHLNSSGCLRSFVFPIMMKATRLHRVTICSREEVTSLNQILSQPNMQQSLKVLSLENCFWARTGLPFPNQLNFQLTRLDMNKVRIADPDMRRVLEGCKKLRSLKVLDVLTRWNVPLLNIMSKHNRLLKTFRFSRKPSSASLGEVDDAQLESLCTNLNLDLQTLGLHRLNVTSYAWQTFQEKFGKLTRLEVLGRNHWNCGLLIHKYLKRSSGLEHLLTESVYIPMYLISEKGSTWACRGLKTLEVGFRAEHDDPLGPEFIASQSKILFEFLAHNVPLMERLLIRKTQLAATKEGGIGALKSMTRLYSFRSEVDGKDIVSLSSILERFSVQSVMG